MTTIYHLNLVNGKCRRKICLPRHEEHGFVNFRKNKATGIYWIILVWEIVVLQNPSNEFSVRPIFHICPFNRLLPG